MSVGGETDALPLEGILVLDFTRLLPGPWCTQMLGDLGADVIKVESPSEGDPSRHDPPIYKTDSVYFNTVNRNKRSVVLDLRSREGQGAVVKLIEKADVVIESFGVGVAVRLGIDYSRIKQLNPRAIYCSITGFGQTGPLARSPGHDLVIQAGTGHMNVVHGDGGGPRVPGFQAADYAAASYATIGILAAILKRKKTNEGCYLDIAMFDSLFSMCNIVLTGALAKLAGREEAAGMQVWGGNPRYAVYRTRDGKAIAVSLLEAKLWAKFCRFIGKEDLIHSDEAAAHRHSDHGERSELYRAAIEEYCLSKTRDQISAEMQEADIPLCPVLSPDEAACSENVASRGLTEIVQHPREGRITQLSNPLARAGLADTRRRPSPELGEHTSEVLREIGCAG
jgi:CoA:oxalate CoA-transferase